MRAARSGAGHRAFHAGRKWAPDWRSDQGLRIGQILGMTAAGAGGEGAGGGGAGTGGDGAVEAPGGGVGGGGCFQLPPWTPNQWDNPLSGQSRGNRLLPQPTAPPA